MSRILVTGGSGFVGSHVVARLLKAGHEVRTTVRSASREAAVKAMVQRAGVPLAHALSFVYADLAQDDGWNVATRDCEYVLHVASPFPASAPRHEDDLVIPAREGTLRVLRAARDAGVRRVVLTSSFAAVGYGHARYDEVFDESDWTNVDGPDVPAYMKSKTLAERAAWHFIASEGGELELSVLNPVGIFGPALGPDLSTSVDLVRQLLDGIAPQPGLYFGVVDVRDLAELQRVAMLAPQAAGERFIAVSGEPVSLAYMASVIRERLAGRAARVHSHAGDGDRPGPVRRSTSAKAQRLLGWHGRPVVDTIVDTAESLIQLGIVAGH